MARKLSKVDVPGYWGFMFDEDQLDYCVEKGIITEEDENDILDGRTDIFRSENEYTYYVYQRYELVYYDENGVEHEVEVSTED